MSLKNFDNSKGLLIVESPAKMKVISGYLKELGYKDWTVLASFGHIVNLISKNDGVDPEHDFAMKWEHTKQSAKALPPIIQAAKNANTLFIATDPDREGEAIGWHIIRELNAKKISLPTKRVLFYSITKKAIQEAIDQASDMRNDLVDAYLARLSLDFLVGFNISPLLWRKLPGCLSAGRVQSAALKNIVELEYEIKKFKPEQYFVVKSEFNTSASKSLNAKLYAGKIDGKLTEFERGTIYYKKDLVDEMTSQFDIGSKESWKVEDVTSKKRNRAPTAPLITSTMQQEASAKLRISPGVTMRLAQQLYEGIKVSSKETVGFITYMRTDNVNMSNEATSACRKYIEHNFDQKYLNDTVRAHKSKSRNAQEAHECIRPTDFTMTPEKASQFISDQMLSLYTLIWRKAVASQMSSAIFEDTTIDIRGEKSQALFQASGSVMKFDGWLKLFREWEDDNLLPEVKVGEVMNMLSMDTEEKETKPPSRYTPATLIARMEKLGIGRPSTYARIIDILIERGYVEKQEAYLVPTQKSWFLISFLEKYFSKYVEYEFTAKLEEQLDEIANGEAAWKKILNEFWGAFSKNVLEAKDVKYDDMRADIEKQWSEFFFPDGNDKCAKCGAKAQVRFWNGRGFVSCSLYPDCDWTRPLATLSGDSEDGPKMIGTDPETGQEIRLLNGQYGKYYQWEPNEQHKIKRVSLPLLLKDKELSMKEIMTLKNMPRKVGNHPETGEEISVGFGKFGPYIKYQDKFTQLKGANPMDVDLATCLEILSKPKTSVGRGRAGVGKAGVASRSAGAKTTFKRAVKNTKTASKTKT